MTVNSAKLPTADRDSKPETTRPSERPMQVVVRALRTLTVLGEAPKGLTLQELHQRLGIPIGSMHRLLATLLTEDFVTRSPLNRRYFLGRAARMLSPDKGAGSAFVSAPEPLVDAAKESGETLFLTELLSGDAVCVALVEARHPLRLFVRIGQEMPLHAAASARVILAYQNLDITQELLARQSLKPFTKETPTEIESVLAHLETVREQGFDVCSAELDPHVWAVSAPVFNASGTVTSSITLAAAAIRMVDPLVRTRATETVLTAARQLSAEQGHIDSVAHQDQSSRSKETTT